MENLVLVNRSLVRLRLEVLGRSVRFQQVRRLNNERLAVKRRPVFVARRRVMVRNGLRSRRIITLNLSYQEMVRILVRSMLLCLRSYVLLIYWRGAAGIAIRLLAVIRLRLL